MLSLTKSGSGTLTLSSSNSYMGGTTVTGGTLIITNANALPPGGVLSITGSGTVILGSNLATAVELGGLSFDTGGGRCIQRVALFNGRVEHCGCQLRQVRSLKPTCCIRSSRMSCRSVRSGAAAISAAVQRLRSPSLEVMCCCSRRLSVLACIDCAEE